MNTKVYITGIGLLSPIGNTVSEFTESLLHGRDGFRPVLSFDTTAFPYDRGALIGEFPQDYADVVAQNPSWETAEHYGVHCATRALADAGLTSDDLDPFRTAVVVASSTAGVETSHHYAESKLRGDLIVGTTLVHTPGTATSAIRHSLGLRGPQASVSTACAAGSNSVGLAYDLIRAGKADVAIAGGVEPISMLSYSGFTLLKSLTHDALRPFDEHRDGTGLGEAACIFVLESASSAIGRGATIYGEVAGYGISNDAHHATAPDPSGRGAVIAIEQCLEDAGLEITDVDYINAHGTGTRYNDVMELTALAGVFGSHLKNVPLSSTKPLHGHTLSCAGSIELLVCLVALKGGFVPGNLNTDETMHEFVGLFMPKDTVEMPDMRVAISNSFGFGGNNTCIAVRRYVTNQ
ncbi:beta-ketoacyl-[acyl-carrier-protein] synthase family protein [Cryobacterium sp. TMS1-13-1]|uniref:beta-ketoacyl-[acyl-carrier-protein] synthase family protein n=1 Tax=Cryobacterium sp. TMS1-13-1 TaxID=1259220 RepID=UPI00106C3684|nr:beta-ketoacyl-[acyl-carrier-protein] synthase family protein [Cryobacterium sp. TMS1-13-1]TFD19197.1 beta-ketoacyl-[acyl-carrier-protein] synthase family protein [Cryobacterium sp. TMS1-13-1]